MKKRLLAAFLAVCMAGSTAIAAFAAGDEPIVTEPPAIQTEIDSPQDPPPEETAVPSPQEPEPDPAQEPELDPAPTPEATEQPSELPESPEATEAPQPSELPQEPESTPTETPASEPESTPPAEQEPSETPSGETPEPTETPEALPEVTATPAPTPTAAPVKLLPQRTATPETATFAAEEEPAEEAAAVVLNTLELKDTITTNGCLTAFVNSSEEKAEGVSYVWERCVDGTNWQTVSSVLVSGTERNWDPEQPQKLNAAVDAMAVKLKDSERCSYRVTVTDSSGNKQSKEMQVSYYVQLQNGGFEVPAISSSGTEIFEYSEPESDLKPSRFIQWNSENPLVYWKTTAEAVRYDEYIEIKPNVKVPITGAVPHPYIEIVDGVKTDSNDPMNTYKTDRANSGNQFAELNCEAYGALYQDVLTVPGSTLYWSLAHRGRKGTDTMVLLVAPVSVADTITDTLKNCKDGNVEAALQSEITVDGVKHPISDFIVKESGGSGIIADSNNAWGTHSGTYLVPTGQYLSRFFFLAVSCASQDKCVGNLLDDVWFSAEPAPTQAETADLVVRKTLTGAEFTDAQRQALWDGLEFTVTRSGDAEVTTIKGSAMREGSDPNTRTITLRLPLTSTDGTVEYHYTVTETSHSTPASLLYVSSRTALNGDWSGSTTSPSVRDITLSTGTETTADFENTYILQTGNLQLRKRLPAGAEEQLTDEAGAVTNVFVIAAVPVGTYRLTYSEGSRPEGAPEEITLNAPGPLTIPLVGLGTVTIEGLPANTYTVTETEHPDLENYYLTVPAPAASARITAGQTAELEMVNQYEAYRSVTLTKRVTGGMGDTSTHFAFAGTVNGTPITSSSTNVQVSGNADLTANGFTLAHKGSITITKLKPTDTITFTEAESGYTTSFATDNETQKGRSYTGTAAAAQVICINNKEGVPPTGLACNPAPAAMMLLAAAVCLWLRRRKEW